MRRGKAIQANDGGQMMTKGCVLPDLWAPKGHLAKQAPSGAVARLPWVSGHIHGMCLHSSLKRF